MTKKKVIRAYSRDEVLATLRKKSRAAPLTGSFNPYGLEAGTVLSQRRAALANFASASQQEQSQSLPESSLERDTLSADFATRVFMARRTGPPRED